MPVAHLLLALQAAPAPAPPPPPPAWDPFFVFFDSGSARLGRKAERILDAASRSMGAYADPRVEVTGHADRQGSSASNLALSRRRAEAVAAALVARGVPSAAIATAAKGEDQPLVATADGVAEAQNRYATIMPRPGTAGGP